MTELADTLTRDEGLPFRTAHRIAAAFAGRRAGAPTTPDARLLAEASHDVLGRSIVWSDERLARVLSAEHFVAVRRTLGGPAPERMSEALARSTAALEADAAWLCETRTALVTASEQLAGRLAAL
jgi:argininosuccinate lyase